MAQITHKEVCIGIRDALIEYSGLTDIVPENNIKRGKPKDSTTFPLIRMFPQAGADDVETMGARVFQIFYISVIAVSESNDEADDISKLIDLALERQHLEIGDDQHNGTACVRMQTIFFNEDGDDGKNYAHSGGTYRIGVNPT